MNPAIKHFEFDTKPATPAEEAIAAALSARLRELAEKPITARVLIEVEAFARTAREMLIAGKAPGQARRSMGYGPMQNYGMLGIGDDSNSVVMAPSSGQENFGMTAMREGTGMVGQLVEIANRLVERHGEAETVKAIAAARKEGLTDVAAKLEARLFGDKKMLEDAPGPDLNFDDNVVPSAGGEP